MLVYSRERAPGDASIERSASKLSTNSMSAEKQTTKAPVAKQDKLPKFSNLLGGTPDQQTPNSDPSSLGKLQNPQPNQNKNKFTVPNKPSFNGLTKIDPSKPHPLFGLPLSALKPDTPTPIYLVSTPLAGSPATNDGLVGKNPTSTKIDHRGDDVLKKRPPVLHEPEPSLKKPVSVSAKSAMRKHVFETPRSKLKRFNLLLRKARTEKKETPEPALMRVRSVDLNSVSAESRFRPEQSVQNTPLESVLQEIPLRRVRTTEVVY